MNDLYKIYLYKFPDGKVYIGMTKNDLATRRDQGYQHNKPLQEEMRKTGWGNIKTLILEDGLTKESACEREKFYISKFDSTNPKKGFNISKGGKATFKGLHHSKSHRQHLSELY